MPFENPYVNKKWTKEEKQQVVDLREKGYGPQKISRITGFPLDQIRFWLYGDRQKKKNKRNKEKNRLSSIKSYYRMKHNNWFSWKAGCYRSSLNRISNNDAEIPSKNEIENYLMCCEKICPYCNVDLTQENISLDHKIPTARGGSSKIDNLVLCCKKCNSAKGSLNEKEYISLLKCVSKWEDRGSLCPSASALTDQSGELSGSA